MRPLLATVVLAAAVSLSTFAPPASADGTSAARARYEEATQAYRAGEYARASLLFAEADKLSPNPAALEAALRAAMLADDPLAVMSLVKRAKGRQPEGSLADLVDSAKETFAERIGKLLVTCPAPCSATVDGEPIVLGRARSMATGHHLVELQRAGEIEKRLVRVVANKTAHVEPGAPDPEPKPAKPAPTPTAAAAPERQDAPEIRGLSPVWFWAAAGTTVALGAATIASAVDTSSIHDAYEATPTVQGSADGKAAQTRTQVLLGFSAGALAATTVMGIFAVRWSEPARPQTRLVGSVSPIAGGASASLSGRF